MKVIYCDKSAIRFYRMTDVTFPASPLPKSQCESTLLQASEDCMPTALKQLNHSWLLSKSNDDTIHILVSSEAKVRKTDVYSYHIWNRPMSKGSLIRIGDLSYVVSPELLFAQMAQWNGWIELALLGIELCGRYKLPNTGQPRTEPLTTPTKLRRFIERQPSGKKGIRTARKALCYVRAGARSPMEAITMLLLCLPRTAGGYGYKLPTFNYKVHVPKNLRCADGRESHYCDLYWEDGRLDVEYDSDEEHDPTRIIRDSQRSATLTSLGISVISLRKGDVYTASSFDQAAAKIGKAIGARHASITPRMKHARIELRKRLLFNQNPL